MRTTGPLRPGARYPLAPTLLRVYLLVGAAALAVGFLLYFQSLARRVERQTEAMSEIVAQFVRVAAYDAAQAADSSTVVQYNDIIRRLDFPLILANLEPRPIVWNPSQVGVESRSLEEIFAVDLADPDPGFAKLLEIQRRLDGLHEPIPLNDPAGGELIGYIHYGSPALRNELRWTPWVAILVSALFGVTALASLRSIKRSEQGFVWAGMAKETAHQMGTPISSLMGWVEVLRTEVAGNEERVSMPAEFFREVVQEIERDADRLNRVAARFSQIGSTPKLTRGNVLDVVRQTVDYFEARLPRQAQRVELTLEHEDRLPEVAFNAELLSWVLENLVKNAVNAADKEVGRVALRVAAVPGGKGVRIVVRDNGRGVQPGMEGQIFRPGVSTRERGWGLGLPLARRIVGDYHGGRLELTWSSPGEGAEFTVTLPAAE